MKTTNCTASSEAQSSPDKYEEAKKLYTSVQDVSTSPVILEYVDSRTAYCSDSSPCNIRIEINIKNMDIKQSIYEINRGKKYTQR